MRLILKVTTLLVLNLMLVGCAGSNSGPAEKVDASVTENSSSKKSITKLQYFSGGFYTLAGQANWTHDFTLTSAAGTSLLTGKVPDSDCQLSSVISESDMALIAKSVNELQLEKSQGPIRADGGSQYLTITREDGESTIVYLDSHEAPSGALIANNGAQLKELLLKLYDESAMYCPVPMVD